MCLRQDEMALQAGFDLQAIVWSALVYVINNFHRRK